MIYRNDWSDEAEEAQIRSEQEYYAGLEAQYAAHLQAQYEADYEAYLREQETYDRAIEALVEYAYGVRP